MGDIGELKDNPSQVREVLAWWLAAKAAEDEIQFNLIRYRRQLCKTFIESRPEVPCRSFYFSSRERIYHTVYACEMKSQPLRWPDPDIMMEVYEDVTSVHLYMDHLSDLLFNKQSVGDDYWDVFNQISNEWEKVWLPLN